MNHTQQEDEYRASRFWYTLEAAFEYFIAILTSGAFLARITKELGFSDSLTGILSAFVSLGCVFRLMSPAVFRGTARVKPRAVAMQLIHELLFVAVYAVPVLPMTRAAKNAVFLTGFFVSNMLINLIRSQKANWTMSIVEDRKRGVFTARMEIISLLSGMLFTFAMGNLIDGLEGRGNLRGAFIAMALVILALTGLQIFSMLRIREKPLPKGADASGFRQMFSLLKDRDALKIILIGALWNVASYVSTPFYGAYQVNALGFSMTFVSVLSIIYSVARALVSPFMGVLADRYSFSRMSFVCYVAAMVSFFVNTFTTPANGKIMFTIYYVFWAVAMAGINSSVINLIFDYMPEEKRSDMISLNGAVSGVCGFLTTCAVSPLVALIQNSGNCFLGVSMYPVQLVSFLSFLAVSGLLAYMYKVIFPMQKRAR